MELNLSFVTVDSIFKLSNFLDNGLIIVTVERRDSSEQNIEDYSCWPNITVLVIRASNNFRRDVIRLNHYKSTVPTNFFYPLAANYARMLSFHL